MNTEEAKKKTQRDLTGAVLRAARELRNAVGNICTDDEPEAAQAWKRLDEAIRERDDFMHALTDDDSASN